jgi:macrodomain Ter protein organizer (MatP/YcbG family)
VSSKFGLPSDDLGTPQVDPQAELTQRLSAFPSAARSAPLALHEVDAAAAAHGFVSREQSVRRPRRRRIAVAEPTRHLAIRLPESQYNRFVLYADQLKLTYHDALRHLLDQAGVQLEQSAISPR